MATATIPNRPAFRAQEVCEIAEVQLYVLRSWEAEFPDLGVAKTPAGPRIYRRADVERVLRLKHLLFVDGLTLAGARKQLSAEGAGPVEESLSDADMVGLFDAEARRSLQDIRRGLQWILSVVSGDGLASESFVLQPEPAVVIPQMPREAVRPAKRRSKQRSPKDGM